MPTFNSATMPDLSGAQHNQQVHCTSAGLTARGHHGRSQMPMAGGHRVVARQRVELPPQRAQSLGTNGVGTSDEDTEMQLGQCDCADSQLSG